MASNLAVAPSFDLAEFEDLIDQAADYVRASRSPNTLRAYEADLRRWVEWCRCRGVQPLPAHPEVVALFITSEASIVKPGTLARRLSSIRWAHEQSGYVSPTSHPKVRAILSGVRRVHGSEPVQRRPIYLDDLRAMIAELNMGTVRGVRDRTVLVVGWWSACRRSELSALRESDITEHPEGFALRVRRSKTDQDGLGRKIPLAHFPEVSLCPVRALRAWLPLVDDGPVLRSVSRWDGLSAGRLPGEAISRIVKENGARIGIDPATLGGHSLRAGFVSEADRRGVPDRVITQVTGHRTTAMLSTYSRPRSLFADGPAPYFATDEGKD